MNGIWYLIERFDDALNGYQVERRVLKAEYEKIAKEIKEYGRSGKLKSIQRELAWYDKCYQQSDSNAGARSSVDRSPAEYGREDPQMVRMASPENYGRERTGRDGSGDRESGGSDRQEDPVTFSLSTEAEFRLDENGFDIDAEKQYNGTKLSEIRGDVYETERRGIQTKTEGIFRLYYRSDFGDYVFTEGGIRKGTRYNNQLGAERGAGSRTTQKAQRGIQSPFLPVVHQFQDLTGRKRNVRKVNKEFMIEGSTKAKKVDQPKVRTDVKKHQSPYSSKVYAYSIADFLENVKGVFDNTFSRDVYEKLGMTRREDDFSKPLHFSISTDAEREAWLKAHPDVESIEDLEDIDDLDPEEVKRSGKKANEVSYGRQDIDTEALRRGRKNIREHGASKNNFSLANDSGKDASKKSEVDNSTEVRYNYNKQQYECFGWAREAGAIKIEEIDDLFSKIKAMRVLRTTNTSFLGEKIIKVNDDPKKNLGVNKVLVFVKGTKNNFFITRVVRFDVETEAEMEVWEDGLYEKGKISDSYLELYQKQGIVTQYKVEDTPSFNEYKSRSRYTKYFVEYLLVAILSVMLLVIGPRLEMRYRIVVTEIYILIIIFFFN